VSVLPHPTRQVRVIGFDDAPFAKRGSAQDAPVQIAGVVCSGTRFEGMVWDRVTRDGFDATDVIAARLLGGKFLPQVHAILFDGVTVGGLNIINIAELSERLSKPCITVMRKMPDLEAFRHVIASQPEPARRLVALEAAGEIVEREPFFFQAQGIGPDDAHELLTRVTDTGHVPEALRLAHLIGAAIMDGESRGRA